MKCFKYLLLLFVLISFDPMITKAESDVYRLDVGEEDTFWVPSSVTNTSISTYYWSNNSPSAIEIVSSSFSSITVRVLQYQYSRALLQLDYYRKIDGRRETYDLYIDIRKPELTLSASPSGGKVKKGQYVELICNKSDADIYYTLDGSTPYEGGQKYDKWNGIVINKSCTLKAIAYWCGVESDMLWKDYTVEDQVTPKMSLSANPPGGTVSKGTKVYLTASESGGDIYYTLDGNQPTNYDNLYYSSGITINETCTLKAVVYKGGDYASDILTEYYYVGSGPDPAIEPTNISVYPSSKTIRVEETFNLTYTLTPSNAETNVTWTSDDSSIATVSSSGMVTGKKAGSTNINVITSNGKTDYCSVTVEDGTSPGVDVTINSTNFPDENFRKYLLEQDYGKDGVITAEEISKVKDLRIEKKDISDLKGIEFLSALETLTCYQNQLTSLDVSNNTALIKLWCYNNQLSSLDVSKNTVLKVLNCSDNQLTSLNVSNNTALETLNCYNNQLTSLDVTKNALLTGLHLGDFQLSSIDVSKNLALEKLSVQNCQLTSLDVSNNTALIELWCSNNQLSSLDISKNTELKVLYCDQNQLTSLDVSKNLKLKTISCCYNLLTTLNVSKHTILYNLYCYDNQLTSLDVTGNTALSTLVCDGNRLTSLDLFGNTALEELSCFNNQLTSLDLSENTSLTYFSCHLNQIRGTEMDALINSLPQNTTTMDYKFYVVYDFDNMDGNVCTTTQVAAAKAKGWTPYYYGYSQGNYDWWEYAGSDPSAIKKILMDHNNDSPVYDLSGKRLTEPQKGINIIGQKKVFIK